MEDVIYIINIEDYIQAYCSSCIGSRPIFVTYDKVLDEVKICCCVCQHIHKKKNLE